MFDAYSPENVPSGLDLQSKRPKMSSESESHQQEVAITEDQFAYGYAFGSSRDEHQQATYTAHSMSNLLPPYSPIRLFSSHSNGSSSQAGFPHSISSASQFPSVHQQSQTIPSFSSACNIPSASTVLQHSLHQSLPNSFESHLPDSQFPSTSSDQLSHTVGILS